VAKCSGSGFGRRPKSKWKSAHISVNIWSYEKFKVAKLSGLMRAVHKCTQTDSFANNESVNNYLGGGLANLSGPFYMPAARGGARGFCFPPK
jgi:hypothetical protein